MFAGKILVVVGLVLVINWDILVGTWNTSSSGLQLFVEIYRFLITFDIPYSLKQKRSSLVGLLGVYVLSMTYFVLCV